MYKAAPYILAAATGIGLFVVGATLTSPEVISVSAGAASVILPFVNSSLAGIQKKITDIEGIEGFQEQVRRRLMDALNSRRDRLLAKKKGVIICAVIGFLAGVIGHFTGNLEGQIAAAELASICLTVLTTFLLLAYKEEIALEKRYAELKELSRRQADNRIQVAKLDHSGKAAAR